MKFSKIATENDRSNSVGNHDYKRFQSLWSSSENYIDYSQWVKQIMREDDSKENNLIKEFQAS